MKGTILLLLFVAFTFSAKAQENADSTMLAAERLKECQIALERCWVYLKDCQQYVIDGDSAAIEELAFAEFQMGHIYGMGFEDYKEVGNTDALFALAECYLKGRGVPQNYALAKEWCAKAMQYTPKEAQKILKKIGNKE